MSRSSKRFALYFFVSEEYEQYFEAIVSTRLTRGRVKEFKEMFWFPKTITYSVPRKIDCSKLLSEGMKALEGCLFKLAVERGECWDFSKKRRYKTRGIYGDTDDENMLIPLASYDSNMLKYFKVAISSQFPSQSFLAFYHILEYNFLTVSDEALHGRLKSHIHSTNFYGTDDQLETIISVVKKHNDKSDETEMLSRVLRKYIDEDELIEHINDIESKVGEKLYTKSTEIFGERFQVQNKKDHAITNVAKLLKHVRNALVHSSARYNRDDCHIPLTESEFVVESYIPLIRFLAEKVIYAKSL
ncbi:MAG: hypothetical protein ABIJ24_01895 [Nitrospinota bacterium]|nr:hypothetical protein [Nitrospinota bacterium]